ncbi:hypothetical protein CIRMBP1271_00415 [Enterococcus cecorum]|uniref:hypothetical protein n=1 Tax=Enterococcus cecorum TaxID=44008 RepID=UPI000657E476|nr:hypothetical protein AA985_01105 [Enterococcus cecorum]CAI3255614.1 hypothetical protein CIRMBP1243_00083 [Enterococcus cecorum]CAI3256330.1 hypothetical protein CIRMBP1217_00070 [Enterococcus cecorum]CAI3256625.1 hypothetical protein CIRMBP1226_00098 [Enterococcus cecorum]CAI3256954.1 hypothetical protein CIRMBP1195_00070 [Enterococcus cecorum]
MILNGLKTSKDKTKFTDSEKLHYVKVPENHIVIDFDLKDENGNKSIHYIYSGDATLLSRTLRMDD